MKLWIVFTEKEEYVTALSSREEGIWEFPNKVKVVGILENGGGGQVRREGNYINDFVVFK